MNLSKGLQRVSAVWWGLVAGVFILYAVGNMTGQQYIGFAVVLGAIYGLHWITCWIVKGFFGDGK